MARGWATVDFDRAAVELGGSLREGSRFEPVQRCAALGARCRRGASAEGNSWIVLLEPDTEGRIAAFLARHGEGWAATWLDAEDADDPGPPVATSGASTPGPLGPERLEQGPPFGPFRLRVAAATIGA